jgi:mannosyltransferase
MAEIKSQIAEKSVVVVSARGEQRKWLVAWPRAPFWLSCLALFVPALALNLYRLGSPSIWFDEAFSVELARQPLPLLLRLIFGPEPNMELYYLFLHFWLRFTSMLGFTPTEIVVRLPSAVFAALSVVVVFAFGRRFIHTFAGTLGALLYLANDAQLIYAQQARSYSLQLLLLTLSWYALLAALTGERSLRRWWVAYVLATTLAVYAHLFSMLLILAQICVVAGILLLPNAWRLQARERMRAGVMSLLSCGLLCIPMLLVSLQGAKTGWLPVPHLGDIINLLYGFAGYHKIYALALAICCLLCVALFTAAYLLSDRLRAVMTTSQTLLPAGWMLLCWFAIPLFVSYVVSQGATRLFSARYLVVIVPALCLLMGWLVTSLRWRVVQVALSLLLLGLSFTAVPYYYASAQVEDWNSTVPWMQQHYQPGDGLVCYDNTIDGSTKQGCQIAVEYYLHAYPNQTHFSPDAPGSFSWSTYSTPHPDAAINPSDLARYASGHPHLFWIVGRVQNGASERVQAAQQWLDSHYRFIDQVKTRTVTIRWYNTSA